MPVAVLGSGDEWLSLTLKFAAAGLHTRAIGNHAEAAEAIQGGVLPRTGLPVTAERLLLKAREEGALEVGRDWQDARGCESIVLAPKLTGVRARKQIDIGPLGVLIEALTGNVAPGALVVVAARLPPGVMQDFVRPR